MVNCNEKEKSKFGISKTGRLIFLFLYVCYDKFEIRLSVSDHNPKIPKIKYFKSYSKANKYFEKMVKKYKLD